MAKGEWIKYIAGDDFMAENCIGELMNFVYNQREEIKIAFSDHIVLSGKCFHSKKVRENPDKWFCSKESTAFDQYQMLLRSNRVFAQTVIIRKDLLELINGFDERYRLLEDWPAWVKITSKGYKIYHLSKALVFYRASENNLTQANNENYIVIPASRLTQLFRREIIGPKLPVIERIGLWHELIGTRICLFMGNNRKNYIALMFYYVFRFTNPFSIYRRILKYAGQVYRYDKYLDYHVKW